MIGRGTTPTGVDIVFQTNGLVTQPYDLADNVATQAQKYWYNLGASLTMTVAVDDATLDHDIEVTGDVTG